MNTLTYKVVFRGDLVAGYEQEQVKCGLAKLYRVPVSRVTPWFSGKPVIIRKNLDQVTAQKYCKAMKKVGAICVIEPYQSLVEPPPLPQSKSELSTMRCPKCHWEQPPSDTCQRCGIIISRYRQQQAAYDHHVKDSEGKRAKIPGKKGRTEQLSPPQEKKSFFGRRNKKSFPLEANGKKRLEISWKGRWKEVSISLDGQVIGYIPDKKALLEGQTFQLPDGSTVTIQLLKSFWAPELHVLRNGHPLPGSASDPQTWLKGAYGTVYFIAGLSLVLGSIALFFDVNALQQIGLGVGSIIFGLVFLVLGFFIQRQSAIALILAIIIYALDGIVGFLLTISHGYSPPAAGIIMRVFLLFPMIRGVSAIKALKQPDKAATTPPAPKQSADVPPKTPLHLTGRPAKAAEDQAAISIQKITTAHLILVELVPNSDTSSQNRLKLTPRDEVAPKHQLGSIAAREVLKVMPVKGGITFGRLHESPVLFHQIYAICVSQFPLVTKKTQYGRRTRVSARTTTQDVVAVDLFLGGTSRPYRILCEQVDYQQFFPNTTADTLEQFRQFVRYLITNIGSVYLDKETLEFIKTGNTRTFRDRPELQAYEKRFWGQLIGVVRFQCENCGKISWVDGDNVPEAGARTTCVTCQKKAATTPPTPKQSADVPSKKQSRPTKAAQEQTARMVCLKCHYEQPTSETCIQCGVAVGDDHVPQQQAPTEGKTSPSVFMQRGKPPWAGQKATPSQSTDIYVDADFVKILHFFSVPAFALILIALLLPMLNFSYNSHLKGVQILLYKHIIIERSPQPEAQNVINRLETALYAIILASVGVSVIGAFGVRDVPESPKGIGLLSCGIGLAAALWVGLDFGSKANIEMGPGYYLILATFIAGMFGFLSPFLCNARNSRLQILAWPVLGGTMIVLVVTTIATLTPDAQGIFMWMSVGGIIIFIAIMEINSRLKKMKPERDVNAESWMDERSLFLRILFGILWFIAISFTTNIVIGAFVGAIAGASAQSYQDSFTVSQDATMAFFQKYGLVVLFFQFLVTVLLSFLGLLPGTGRFKSCK